MEVRRLQDGGRESNVVRGGVLQSRIPCQGKERRVPSPGHHLQASRRFETVDSVHLHVHVQKDGIRQSGASLGDGIIRAVRGYHRPVRAQRNPLAQRVHEVVVVIDNHEAPAVAVICEIHRLQRQMGIPVAPSGKARPFLIAAEGWRGSIG